jgi:teichoic acid transport system permease protein
MFSTFIELIVATAKWRKQIVHLAIIDLRIEIQGAALGWFWLFTKPLMYVVVFTVAIHYGLRGGREISPEYPFLLWLTAGLFAWFFLSKMFGSGSNVFKREKLLITESNVPMVILPCVSAMSDFIIYLVSISAVLIVAMIAGYGPSIYWLQLPIVAALMFIFFVFFSLLVSSFSMMSKDFNKLVRTMSMPFFWLSGIIVDLSHVQSKVIIWIDRFNPVSVLVSANRAAICDHVWFWSDPWDILPFAFVLVALILISCANFRYLRPEIYDAL